MLMDLFYQHSTAAKKKTLIHFHDFMLDVHKRVFKKIYTKELMDNVLKAVAGDIVHDKGRLLCFDDFQVTDIADAMILKGLFTALFKHNVTMVITSNRSPADLYLGGLNRALFLPFLPVLTHHCKVVDMTALPDYRTDFVTDREDSVAAYVYPLNKTSTLFMEKTWNGIRSNGKENIVPEVHLGLRVGMGRRLHLPRTVTLKKEVKAAHCTFPALCEVPLGAADYTALANQVSILLLTDIPLFKDHNRNAARRFITLIDLLYANHVLVFFSAAAPAAALMDPSLGQVPRTPPSAVEAVHHVQGVGGSSGRSTTMIGATEWSATGILGASLFMLQAPSVREDEVFAFKRTVSRLTEMQHISYQQEVIQKRNLANTGLSFVETIMRA